MGDDGKGKERRQSRRVEARVEVRFSEANAAARALRAYSLNLSVGGLCLRTQKTYPVGAAPQLTLKIGGEEFDLLGVVAWTRNGAIGVRFEDLAERDRQRLEEITGMLVTALKGQ